VAIAYHLIATPVADKSATVGLSIAQKLWATTPVGATGSAMDTVTAKRLTLSQSPV